MITVQLGAPDRRNLQTLIEVRKQLEQGSRVEVRFADGSPRVTYQPSDLYAIRQKIIFSM